MKRFFTIISALIAATTVWAYDVQIGDLYYDLSGNNAAVTYNDSAGYFGDIIIPASFVHNQQTYTVTSIDYFAFGGCHLSSISIPNSVTHIGDWAFWNCTLSSIILPSCLSYIGSFAFAGCNIDSISIPNGVQSIEFGTFSDCKNLVSVNMGNCINYIEGQAFRGCTSLSSITIPTSVTNIGDDVFRDCSNLKNIIIPSSVNSIGNNVFEGCTSLPVEDGIRYADIYLVKAEDSFKSTYTIKDGTKWVGNGAFGGCVGMKSIIIPNSVISIENNAFRGCYSLTSISIPTSIKTIGHYAFYDCTRLNLIEWNAKSCNDFANSGRDYYTTWPFYNAGRNAESMTIFIGDSVEVVPLGLNVYNNYKPNTSFYSKAQQPPIIHQDVMSHWNGTLYVPCQAVEAYRNAEGWTTQVDTIAEAFVGYYISVSSIDATKGLAVVDAAPSCETHSATIRAIPNKNYNFSRWTDGSTDNPRQVIVSQDTCFVAIFEPVLSGMCGDSVTWSFDTISKTITLDGSGDTYEMDTMELAGRILPPWTHLNDDIDSIVVKQNVGLVRGNAFYYCKNASAVYDYRQHIGQNLIYAPFVKGMWDWWQPDTTQNYHIICFADGYYLDSIGLMRDLFVPSVIILETDTTIGRVEILEHETECGGSALIAAYPLDSVKYRFSHWSDGNKNAVRELSTHDYWGNLDTVSATAFFELNQYSVNFNATDGGYVDKEPCYLMYMDTIRFSAMPYYGYHFDKWSDGVATSSRIEVVRQDTQYTAIFARDTFTITTQANNAEWGKTYGDTSVLYYHMVTIYAESNYGYHFDHWMDGSTDSYRNVKVDSNKVYIAIFAPDARYVNISCNEGGNVEGDINPYRTYLDTITFTAVPQYGYHFVQWSDGVTAATRTEIVRQDTSYYAVFAKNLYHVSVQWNSEYGSVTGDTCGLYEYQTNFKTIITPKYAYWAHDGKSYYPFEFTQYTTIISDTTIIIDFQPMQGKYGENVTWTLGTDSVLRFTGSGDMYNTKNTNIGWGAITKTIKKGIVSEGITSVGFYAFGRCTTMTSVELPSSVTLIARSAFSCCESLKEIAIPGNVTSIESDAFYDCQSLTSVTIPNEVHSIGSYAFAGCSKLTSIIFGSKLSSIGTYAFQNCYYVDNMTIFAETPPTVESTTFASLSKYAYLNVPSGSLRAYQMALYWRDFLVQAIGAEPIPTVDDVQVDVSSVSVTITWPKNGKAGSYTIEIKKDGRVIFALTFNAQGQLINITFAPGRGINNNVDAIAVEGGFRFTITSLNPGTTYTYSIDTKDEEGTSIRTDTGAFTTTGETPTGINEVDSQKSKVESRKFLRDGILLIERNGVYYNAQGTVVE